MNHFTRTTLGACLVAAGACAGSSSMSSSAPTPMGNGNANLSIVPPTPDPRVGLKAGLWDAGQAAWNMRLVSTTRPVGKFLGSTNSDMAFTGPYVIQGNYDGYQIWDISNPQSPSLKVENYCPASQSDVSVYKNLLFVSAEGATGRIDCGDQGVPDPVSQARIRGVRIFDITDIGHPKNVANVQTCRGSHTHTVLVDPADHDNVYVYVSGSSAVRPSAELPGCSGATPAADPNSALFRIEVIKVPLTHPQDASIVASPRIFNNLAPPPTHGSTSADKAEVARVRASGGFVVGISGDDFILPPTFTNPMVDSIAKARGASKATAADSAALRMALPAMIAKMIGGGGERTGPTQCHDITVYPAVGLAGGACEGYGLLLDIKNPTNPTRIAAAADSNFSYWHSATFNNDGTKVLFSDEWGGGGQPKCRSTDPMTWGADALFTIDANRQMHFQGYYKMPAPQTSLENCVAHNGSLIPIPGRDVMVQAWYQGGVSVFDWTDAAHPKEIAFFDRGPVDPTHMAMGGSWSVYWYNGVIVSSEIARGLDIFELAPSAALTQNEIDAAKTVKLDYLNTQGQPKFEWPNTFALARAYVDQIERGSGLPGARITIVRQQLAGAEAASGNARKELLNSLAGGLDSEAKGPQEAKIHTLVSTLRRIPQ
ncbi:MAG TPA: hypothetical protein VGM82_04560 [Gemmatimonadaceae bacterium]